MSDDLRWSATSQIERTVLGGDQFRDLDGRNWTYHASRGWLRHTAAGWQSDPDVPRTLEGSTGPLVAAARSTAAAAPASVVDRIDRGVADLSRAYRAGELSSGQAEAALLGSRVADGRGRIWTVGPRTASWFVLDGGQWHVEPRPNDDVFAADPDPSRVEAPAIAADGLLPERITAPWDPPAPPAMPKPEREPRSRGGARRVLGLVLSIAGLLSTGFGVVNGLNGPSASATASPTTVPLVRSSPSTSTSTSVAPKLTTTTTTAVVAAAPAGREEMQLAPTRVGASSALASTTTSSYGPANAIDGRPETAWCVANDGTGESLTVELAGVPTVTRVGILPGYAKTEGGDRWSENRRPTSVTWSFSSAARYDQSPNTDDRSMQVWSLPSPEQGSRIVLTIGGTTGIANGDTCISEIALFGTR